MNGDLRLPAEGPVKWVEKRCLNTVLNGVFSPGIARGKDVRPWPEYGPETASDGLYRRNKGIKKPSGGPVKVVPNGHVTFGVERSVQITHGSNTQVTLKSHLVSVPTNSHISANALICGTIPTSYHCLSFTLFVLSPVQKKRVIIANFFILKILGTSWRFKIVYV